MRLVRLRFEQYYINQWGRKEMSGSTYRVIDSVEVWLNGETKMVDNGYEPPYPCPVWEADDGRTWLEHHNHIDYWARTHYLRLFEEPRDPALSKYEVGPHTIWETYEDATKMQLVNADLQPVDIEGNIL